MLTLRPVLALRLPVLTAGLAPGLLTLTLTRPLSLLPLLRRLPGLTLQLLSLVLELVLHAHVDSLPLWVRGSGLDQTNTGGHTTHFDQ
ncbi:putative membrane protein [Streptomyces scabiei 87.22]|uniref:Putative membrane protein n=1 Tax=Streptomyces scabiei (strain 87.22) TaxID=680198 RepID=C9YWH6_STRSW|nr:putative membrane protein [Streptomyces scabiei 87.22]